MASRVHVPAVWLIVCLCSAPCGWAAAAPPAEKRVEAEPAEPATRPVRPPPPALPPLANANVSIPWNDLADLIDRARPDGNRRPPVDFVFGPAAYAATVGDTAVRVTADAEVTLLADGWVMLPLGPADAAGVIAVAVDDEPAPVVLRNGGLFVLLDGGGGETNRRKLSVTSERPLSADAARTRFEQPLIPSPLVTFTATIPGANLDVRAPGASAVKVTRGGGRTTVAGSYRGGATAVVEWRQAPPGPAGGDGGARTYADTETLVAIERGLMRSRARVNVRIERGSAKALKLAVDPRAVVLDVTGKDVARWTEQAAGESKTVTIEFANPAEGERVVEITAERDLPEDGGEVTFAPVALDNARRDRGVVAVATVGGAGGFDVRPGPAEASRVSVSALPESLRAAAESSGGTLQIAYRYAGRPASVTLLLEKAKQLAPRVFALTLTRVAVDRGVLRCRAEVTYEILHAGVDTLRVGLPAGVELRGVTGVGVRDTQEVDDGGGKRTLVVGLKDVATGAYALSVDYDLHFDEAAAVGAGAKQAAKGAPKPGAPPPAKPQAAVAAAVPTATSVPILSHPDAAQDRGFVGVEVRGGYEVAPAARGAQGERVDVKELPEALWQMARSPLVIGYRYDAPGAASVALAMTRHPDLDVLVAMSDVCEATTTVTPDGKTVTKMMFVLRNNLKPFMTLELPEGAQVWSAFVDDRPVTPSLGAKGKVLVPLKKSDDVDEDDEKSYRALREKRREQRPGEAQQLQQAGQRLRQAKAAENEPARDLKPYDVEIVFVAPAVKLAERGRIEAALPKCDVPTGQTSWAIFLPRGLRVVEAEGNLTEVARFTLPFRHFGEAEYQRQLAQAQAQQAGQQAQQKLAEMQQQVAKQSAQAAKAQGLLPVRVEIPIVGEIHRFEKFLTVDEAPKVSLSYSRKLE